MHIYRYTHTHTHKHTHTHTLRPFKLPHPFTPFCVQDLEKDTPAVRVSPPISLYNSLGRLTPPKSAPRLRSERSGARLYDDTGVRTWTGSRSSGVSAVVWSGSATLLL